MDHEAYIAALKREKAGYELTGKTDRVKEVDAEISRVSKAKAVTPTRERAVSKASEDTSA